MRSVRQDCMCDSGGASRRKYGSTEVVRGTMEGRIGYEITGENGFGYDPIFYLPQFGCSSAELEPEKKNELSHRGEGLRKMRKVLEEKLESK